MQFMRPTIDKAHSTLSMSMKSTVSTSDSNNNDDDVDSGRSADAPTVSLGTESGRHSSESSLELHQDDSSSDLSYNECDITLIDHDMNDAKNEAELMFFQVVEMLRCEQEVCWFLPFYFVQIFDRPRPCLAISTSISVSWISRNGQRMMNSILFVDASPQELVRNATPATTLIVMWNPIQNQQMEEHETQNRCNPFPMTVTIRSSQTNAVMNTEY